MNKNRNTILLIVIIIFLVCASFLVKKSMFGKTGATALVEQNGSFVAELDLSKDTTMELDNGYGGTNTLTVKDGTIQVTSANCPDLICVRTGAISHTGDVIACLPHELIITIKENGDKKVDSATW